MSTMLIYNIILKKIIGMITYFLIYGRRIVLLYNLIKIKKQTLLNKVKGLLDISLFK